MTGPGVSSLMASAATINKGSRRTSAAVAMTLSSAVLAKARHPTKGMDRSSRRSPSQVDEAGGPGEGSSTRSAYDALDKSTIGPPPLGQGGHIDRRSGRPLFDHSDDPPLRATVPPDVPIWKYAPNAQDQSKVIAGSSRPGPLHAAMRCSPYLAGVHVWNFSPRSDSQTPKAVATNAAMMARSRGRAPCPRASPSSSIARATATTPRAKRTGFAAASAAERHIAARARV